MSKNDDDTIWGLILAAFIVAGVGSYILSEQPQPKPVCPDGTCPFQVVENLADVPPQLRTDNYAPYGSGSCVHASTITLLEWQGQSEMAEWWRANYNSGEYSWRLIQRMESAGLRYAYTDTGDVAFLEWATRNRFAAGVFYFPRHCVNLVELNAKEAVILDNNETREYIRIPREEFLNNWRNVYGGFGFTVVYSPPPPWPKF